MTSTHTARRELEEQSQAVEALRRAIQEQGIHINDDDEVWQSAIEGQTDFIEALHAVLEAIDRDEADAAYLKQRIAQMGARRTGLETRAAKARKAVAMALELSGMKLPLRQAEFTASVGRRDNVDIVDPEKLPDSYRIYEMPKIDRRAIEKDLREGKDVPGARLTPGEPFLQVRRT